MNPDSYISVEDRHVDGGAEPRSRIRQRVEAWLIACFAAGVLVLLAGGFLPEQSLWVDETTQLSGLTLSPVEVLRWLAGEGRGRFGLPDDRMPPLSYWLGWCWAQVFGLTEYAMRWFGVFVSALAAVVVTRAAALVSDSRGALLAGLIFATSPNVVVSSVEIRAYPLFALVSAATFYALIKVCQAASNPARRWLVLLGVCSVGSMYTHFFGLLQAIGAWCAVLWMGYRARAPLRRALLAACAAGVASIGLVPLALASAEMSHVPDQPVAGLSALVRMLYRLVGHPALATSNVASGLAILGVAGLVVIGLRHAVSSPGVRATCITIVVGLGLASLAGFVVKGFNAFSPSYNSWVFTGLVVVCAWPMVLSGHVVQRVALGCALMLIAGQTYAAVMVQMHGEAFSHGAHRRVRAAIEELGGPDRVAVVHESDNIVGYFPLYFDFGDGLVQYAHRSDDRELVRITRQGFGSPVMLSSLSVSRLVFVQTRWESAGDVWRGVKGQPVSFAQSPLVEALVNGLGYRIVRQERVVATAGSLIMLLQR